MSIPLNDFWNLLVESRLLAAAECQELNAAFSRVRGASEANAKTLCVWLIDRGMLSRYQAKLLLAGRSGPFFFGDYRVYDRVESGRLTGLFRAAHRQNGQPVLLYFFTGPATQDLQQWLPVEARTQLAIAVKHPHVSRVDALVQADGYKFLVLEVLDGQSLDELAPGQPLPAGDVCRYLRKAAAGLARLHNLGQIHANIRPDNLWLENSGQLKLLYFPLSHDPLAKASIAAQRNGDYLAPECAMPGGRSADVRSDVYSFGCTAYYLLSGRAPFVGGDAAETARRHRSENAAPLDQLTGVPSSFASLVASMMVKDPNFRIPSAMEIADGLLALMPSLDKPDGARTAESPAAEPMPNEPRPAPTPARSNAAPAAPPDVSRAAPAPASSGSPASAGNYVRPLGPAAQPAAQAPSARAPTAPAPTSQMPASVPAPPPPPPAQPAIWPPGAGPQPSGQPLRGLPPVAMPSTGGPPPPAGPPMAPAAAAAPPPGYGAQYANFAGQPVPTVGSPMPGFPPMGRPVTAVPPGMNGLAVTGPAMPMPGYPVAPVYQAPAPAFSDFTMPDFTTPATPTPSSQFDEVPIVGAGRQRAAFDSSVMNVLESAAAPTPGTRAPVTAKGPARARGPAPARGAAPAKGTRQQAQSFSPQTIGLGIGAVVVVVGVLVVMMMSSGERPDPHDKNAEIARLVKEAERELGTGSPPQQEKEKKVAPAGEEPAGEVPAAVAHNGSSGRPAKSRSDEPKMEVVEDEGQSLWTSPTSGQPIDVQYVPPGTQVLLVLRPADLLRNYEGEKVLAALGPGGAWAKAQIESISGVTLAEMDQLIVAFSSLDNKPPQPALVVRLVAPKPADQLIEAWKNPSPAANGKPYVAGGGWAYHMPPSGKDKVFVVCGTTEMDEVVDMMDGPPPMRKEMEKLLRQTDASRQFTLLAAPKYLQTDGKSLLDGALERLRAPLMDFFGDGVQAASLSMNWGENFFAELRLYSTEIGPDDFAKQIRDRVGQIPDQVESYVVALNPHPYGKLVLSRFPQMLRRLDEFTRPGSEENQAVLRCYLPLPAGHNLIMGTELALFERGGGTIASGPKKPTTPAEALKQKITLSFNRDTLEKTMEMVAREIDWEVVILGSDLQLEGITKNQSFGLDEQNKPAQEILQTVMMKANPDGKLIYIFKPKPEGGKDIIYITTRASAEKRGDKLPPELAKPGSAPAKPKK